MKLSILLPRILEKKFRGQPLRTPAGERSGRVGVEVRQQVLVVSVRAVPFEECGPNFRGEEDAQLVQPLGDADGGGAVHVARLVFFDADGESRSVDVVCDGLEQKWQSLVGETSIHDCQSLAQVVNKP